MIDPMDVWLCPLSPKRFEQVKQKYEELKMRIGQGSNLGVQGARIQSAHAEANILVHEAWNMMAKMGGKKSTDVSIHAY